MKTILLMTTCVVCGVVLGFVTNTLLFFNDVRLPWAAVEPTLVRHESASPSNDSSSNTVQSNRLEPILEPIKADTVTELSQSVNPSLDQQSSADKTVITELSFDLMQGYNSESSISDQQQVLAWIANADLEQITKAFSKIPDDNNRIHEQQWVIGLLAQRRVELDPKGTLLEIEKLLLNEQGIHGDNMAIYMLAKYYARQRPNDLMAWLGNLPENSINSDRLMGMYHTLAEVAPESAIEMIMQNPNLSSIGNEGLDGVLYMWADKDPAAALNWLQQQDDKRLLSAHAESIISSLIYRDLDAAKAVALEFPDLVPESMFLSHEVGALAESDPMAAFAMAQSITDSDMAMSAKQMVLYSWGMTDPVAALDFISTLPEDNERAMYASIIAESVGSAASQSTETRDAMLAWSETLTPDLKMQVLQPLVMQWAEQDPQAAMQWWKSQPDSAMKSNLLESMAWSLPGQQAIDLYPDMDEATQGALSSTIMRHLYENEPAEAQRWYDELPNNTVKQRSLPELFMLTAQDNPQQALALIDDALALNTSNNASSQEMIFHLVPLLAYEHADLAESWLDAADIQEEKKSQLREMIAGARFPMNAYPTSVPYDHYPAMMPESMLYRMEFMGN